jgi:hypothetical protein
MGQRVGVLNAFIVTDASSALVRASAEPIGIPPSLKLLRAWAMAASINSSSVMLAR